MFSVYYHVVQYESRLRTVGISVIVESVLLEPVLSIALFRSVITCIAY